MITTLTTYKELAEWSKAFVDGNFGLLFLVGDPGHGKSFTIRELIKAKTVEQRKNLAGKKKVDNSVMPVTGQRRPDNHKAEPLWIEGGSVSAFKLYQKVHEHLDETIVLDDVDSVYSDRGLVRLLKTLCQTEKVKEVSWTTQSKQLEAEGVPSSYKSRSRVAIIANHWKELNQHVGSLMSRGIMIDFKPSCEEVLNHIIDNKIIDTKKNSDMIDFARDHLWMMSKIDIRDFINAVVAKEAKLRWKETFVKSLGLYELLLVQRLESDNSYPTVEARSLEFADTTHLSRPMYWKYSAKLAELKKERDERVQMSKARKTKNRKVAS